MSDSPVRFTIVIFTDEDDSAWVGKSHCHNVVEYPWEAPPVNHFSIRRHVDSAIDGPWKTFSFDDKKLRSFVIRNFNILTPSSLRAHCDARRRGCIADWGISATMLIGIGMENPSMTSFSSSLVTSSGRSFAYLWFPRASSERSSSRIVRRIVQLAFEDIGHTGRQRVNAFVMADSYLVGTR